jgi:hypothetical protein
MQPLYENLFFLIQSFELMVYCLQCKSGESPRKMDPPKCRVYAVNLKTLAVNALRSHFSRVVIFRAYFVGVIGLKDTAEETH